MHRTIQFSGDSDMMRTQDTALRMYYELSS